MKYYVSRDLKLLRCVPSGGYQYTGSEEECEEYINNARKKFTEAQIEENKKEWVKGKGILEKYYGSNYTNKRRVLDQKRGKKNNH